MQTGAQETDLMRNTSQTSQQCCLIKPHRSKLASPQRKAHRNYLMLIHQIHQALHLPSYFTTDRTIPRCPDVLTLQYSSPMSG